MGYTQGYKNTAHQKRAVINPFFSNFVSSFKGKNNSENIFKLKTQDVSNDKYLKLYRLQSDLVDHNQDILKTTLIFLIIVMIFSKC